MSEANYPSPIRIPLVPTMRTLVQEIHNLDLYRKFLSNLQDQGKTIDSRGCGMYEISTPSINGTRI